MQPTASSFVAVLLAVTCDALRVPAAFSRRTTLHGAATIGTAAASLGINPEVAHASAADPVAMARRYGPLLQGPFDFPSASRATVRRELVPGRMWSFEQVQGVIYVHVPVRMTVVALDGGGLFVYAPVAPTQECLRLVTELEDQYGRVAHILLPTLALEHKAFAGAFAASRPEATLWVANAQVGRSMPSLRWRSSLVRRVVFQVHLLSVRLLVRLLSARSTRFRWTCRFSCRDFHVAPGFFHPCQTQSRCHGPSSFRTVCSLPCVKRCATARESTPRVDVMLRHSSVRDSSARGTGLASPHG